MNYIKTLVILGVVLVMGIIGFAGFGMYISYNNQAVELQEQIKAQMTVQEAFHDKMWKIIQQKAGVAGKYADDFAKIYSGIMEGRYSHGNGQLMQWVKERNPNFDASLYKDLMATIESQRTGFFNEQKKLISYSQEYNKLRRMIPSKWFVGDLEDIDFKIITSTKSKTAAATSVDDDVKLF